MYASKTWIFFLFLVTFGLISSTYAQHDHVDDHNHAQDHSGHDHSQAAHAPSNGHDAGLCNQHHGDQPFDPTATAFHHIGDANAFHIFGDLYFPLPCILYSNANGLKTFLSSKFGHGHHGNGEYALSGYVMKHGEVMRFRDYSLAANEKLPIDCYGTDHYVDDKGKDREQHFAVVNGEKKLLDKKTTLDGGVFGGGITSFWDFSITKDVFTIFVMFLFLFWLMTTAARAYKRNPDLAPSGVQGFIEPIIVFLRDDVARPFIGDHKYEKFFPFLLSLFFFILGLNLIGQIPFFPGSGNVTGNLSVTLVLAIFTFFVVNLNGNRHYWEHIFSMPGVPGWVKIILTPVEFLGIFIKPFTLMLRLFANITAGHIVIISFIGLIFVLGENGKNMLGAGAGTAMAVPLTLFMMAIELLVAFIQAFVFTLLTASYIGAAVEEAH